MKTTPPVIAFLFALAPLLPAGPAASANHAIPASTLDSGGRESSSTGYTNYGSMGMLAGVSTVANPAITMKHGYLSQLYEINGLQLSASPQQVSEGQSSQLEAHAVADDDSLLALEATDIIWSVVSGPVTSISANGLATTGPVSHNRTATIRGTFGELTEFIDLLVMDSLTDNFGMYADDGLPDEWQVRYFGENNPLAAPGVDVTGNGHDNRFAYTADLDPTDHESVFRVRIERDQVDDRMQVIFWPRRDSRNYQVIENGGQASGGWKPVENPLVEDNAYIRTVTDPEEITTRKMYSVEITLPE